MEIKITNKATGESCEIYRDVSHMHPLWVHEQCGTESETELQHMLDGLNVMMWYDDAGRHLGPDEAGIEMFDA